MRAALVALRIVLSLFVLGLLVAGAAGRAHADDDDDKPIKPEARARFARGLEYYKLKEYEAAIAEFEAAFAIDPRNEIVFAQAQAERLSGDCASAVVLYRRFLEHNPPAVHAEAARTSLDKCETALRSGEGTKPVPSAEPPPPAEPPAVDATTEAAPDDTRPAAPVVEAPSPRRERRPFWKDPLGDAFALGGVIAVGVGVGFYVASSSDVDAAADATLYSEHQRLLDRAESRRTYAIVGLGAGSALLVAAAVRWWWPRGDESRPDVALDLRPGGGGLVVGGRF